MDIRSQILVAIMLGLKRNWHILFGLIAGICVGIFMPAQNYPVIHKIIDFFNNFRIKKFKKVVEFNIWLAYVLVVKFVFHLIFLLDTLVILQENSIFRIA